MSASAEVSKTQATMASMPPVESICLTSFGPFLDVTVNPSQAVAEHVREFLEEMMPSVIPSFHKDAIRHEAGLEVSATRVSRFIEDLRASMLRGTAEEGSEGGLNFLLHFGVHNGSDTINIELCGKNCAAFGGPDHEGFVCESCPIITPKDDAAQPAQANRQFYPPEMCQRLNSVIEEGDRFGTIHVRDVDEETVRSLAEVTNTLLGSQTGAPLAVSHNAGYYLCNYLLFSSLAVSADANSIILANNTKSKRRFLSLFIHVVNTEISSAKEQARRVAAFLIQYFVICRQRYAMPIS